MSDRAKYTLWDFAARLCAAVPPLGATLRCFPEWLENSPRATVSGMLLVSVFVCMVPFWKKLKGLAGELSQTCAPVLWLALFFIFFTLKDIVDKMVFISLFGMLGSSVSMLLCRIRNRYGAERRGNNPKGGENGETYGL